MYKVLIGYRGNYLMIDSIEQFDKEIDEIIKNSTGCSDVLFRGQADSSWKIQSTLERIGVPKINCSEFYLFIDKIKPLINPFIDNKYKRHATNKGYPIDFNEYDEVSRNLPEMEYLTYLRHHGFPTPIIDWTESRYISLFFSCENFASSKTNGKVFVFLKKNSTTIDGSNIPILKKIGKYVEAGKRHIAQQSNYLIPLIYIDEWQFITFDTVRGNKSEVYLIKEVEIANRAKISIIKELRDMNINRFTMYLDEDALIRNCADEFALENSPTN